MERIPEVNRYRELGLCTIPLNYKTKIPSIEWTPYKERQPTEEELDKWFPNNGRRKNAANVCGKVSGGLVVLDFEKEHLDLFWQFAEEWQGQRGIKLHEETLVVNTGDSGKHVYLKVGKPVESQRWPAGEIKAEKTYAVAPPSVHPETGETYKIANPEIGILEIHDLKDVGIELKPKTPASAKDKSWVAEKLKGVPGGERDESCIQLAGYFRNIVSEGITTEILLAWRGRCGEGDHPFTEDDVIKCVKSAYTKPLHQEMSPPKERYTPGAYQFDYEEAGVSVKVDRIADKWREVWAQVTVTMDSLEASLPLYQARFNLESTSGKKDFAKPLDAKVKTVAWDTVIGQICFLSLKKFRQGEPLQVLPSTDELIPPKYLVHPILLENQPNIIFGEGGSGKGQTALTLASLLMTGWVENPLGLIVPDERIPVLYLDWETDEANITYTLNRLKNAHGLSDLKLYYRRCYLPFADDLPEIQGIIEKTGAKLLIIDSLAAAVGADLNPAEGATKFLTRDIRQLNITSLIIAHVTKDEKGKRTVYGSVFFGNYARSVWELRGHKEVGEDSLNVALYHTKANVSKLFQTIGLRFAYYPDGILVERQDVSDVHELAKSLTLKEQLKGVLRHGKASVKELVEQLESNESSVRGTLCRYKNVFFNDVDGWGLKDIDARP